MLPQTMPLGEAQDQERQWQGQWQGQRRQGQWQGQAKGQWQRRRTQGQRWTSWNSEPFGGESNAGPTTRSQTQAQQEQGTKRANEDGDQSNARRCSRFMRMPRRLQKKGFEVTCSAEF